MPARKSASSSRPAKAPKASAAPATARPKARKAPAATKRPRAKSESITVASKAGSVTTITCEVDLGFGNQLYIRGDGPGLSWERGTPARNTAPDRWTLEMAGVTRPFAFKCLINDHNWSRGEDFRAEPGRTTVVTPGFH